jgi:hypothetical protein
MPQPLLHFGNVGSEPSLAVGGRRSRWTKHGEQSSRVHSAHGSHFGVKAILLDVVCLDGSMTGAALALVVSVCTRGKERRHVPGRNRV